MDTERATQMVRNLPMSILIGLLKTFIAGLVLVILVSGCSMKRQTGRLPDLILEYGWSPEFKCVINNKEYKCKAMIVEDVEKLKIWIITAQEVCR
jgi:hypothetical protein